jgi:hypothetical protein
LFAGEVDLLESFFGSSGSLVGSELSESYLLFAPCVRQDGIWRNVAAQGLLQLEGCAVDEAHYQVGASELMSAVNWIEL